jgi:hypothetical protein
VVTLTLLFKTSMEKAIHTKDGADGCLSHRGALN